MSHKTVKIFGVKFSKLNKKEAYDEFLSLEKEHRTSLIYTPNTEFIMQAQKDEEFKNVLNEGDLVIPDGIGVIYASDKLNLGLEEKIAGVDFMDKILDYANKTSKSIYLLGGKEGVSSKAAEKILKQYPNIEIAGTHHGYFDEKSDLQIIDMINDVKPDFLFLGLGAPRQEKWLYKYRKILNVSIGMGVGGAIDVWAGNAKRAPKIFIDLGLEWFYRLIKQPSRIIRMLVIPRFMSKVLVYKYFGGLER